MAYPLVNFNSNLNLPDPRASVIDWGGIVNNAVNTFLKARQMGLEADYKTHLIEQDQQRMDLERQKFQQGMRIDEARLTLAQEVEARNALLTNAQIEAEKARTEQARMVLEQQTKERDATQMFLEAQQNDPTYNDLHASVADLNTNDPLKLEDAAKRATTLSTTIQQSEPFKNATLNSKASQQQIAQLLKIPDIANMELDKPRYRGEIGKTTQTMESPDPTALTRLFGSSNFDALSPELQAKAIELERQNQLKIVKTTVPVMYSAREVMANIGKVDANGQATPEAREAANILLQYSGEGGKAQALQRIVEKYRGNLGDLRLEKMARESGASEEVMNRLLEPSEWVGKFTNQLGSLLMDGNAPQDTMKMPDGKTPIMHGTKPWTYGEYVQAQIDDARRQGINASDITAVETFADEWRKRTPGKTLEQSKDVVPASVSELSPDATLGEAVKALGSQSGKFAGEALKEMVQDQPAIAQFLKGREMWNKPLRELTAKDWAELYAVGFPGVAMLKRLLQPEPQPQLPSVERINATLNVHNTLLK